MDNNLNHAFRERASLNFDSSLSTMNSLLEENMRDILDEDSLQVAESILILHGQYPYKIVCCSEEWQNMCGYSSTEVLGKKVGDILQGEGTDYSVCKEFVQNLNKYGKCKMNVVNYKKSGDDFMHCVETVRVFDEDSSRNGYFVSYSHCLGHAGITEQSLIR